MADPITSDRLPHWIASPPRGLPCYQGVPPVGVTHVAVQRVYGNGSRGRPAVAPFSIDNASWSAWLTANPPPVL